MEPTEVHEFSEQMKEAGEKSMTYVSLIISVLAVTVAMVTVMGHRKHTEAVLLQSRAADQWNSYQARRLRVQELEVAADLLNLLPTNDQGAVKSKLAEYHGHLSKWVPELQDNETTARDLEAEVHTAERQAARFDLSEALLQIGVVLASITLLTRHPRYVVMALLLGVVGIGLGVSAFLVH
jgi:hypothetical protein